MNFVGKTIDIFLSTPLYPVASLSSQDLKSITGKLLGETPTGVRVQVTKLGDQKTSSKFPYATLFVPAHKIDFMGIVA